MAIQLILAKEYGWLRNENPLQGSFVADFLTDEVEEQILSIFEEMNNRGGVLGSLEVNYQRNRIQDEGMVYEHRKHTGETPIVGVNTFTDSESSTPPADEFDIEVTRSDKAEKLMVIRRNQEFKESHSVKAEEGIKKLKKTAREGGI